MKSASLKEQI